MPELPAGERDLRDLARRFEDAERRVRALIAKAPEGDRRRLYGEAWKILLELRREDFRAPVVTAYLAALSALGGARARTVRDLSGSLALKLDRGVVTAQGNARGAFSKVTADTLEEEAIAAVVAHEDARGTRWGLGSWARMNTETIGRTASSRGVADAVGEGGIVRVDVGECGLCESLFDGELVVGRDPLPPGHPSCTCTVAA